ncbi:MAG: 30S ribosomal protein S7 [Candidatus Altimarinota bacterium]
MAQKRTLHLSENSSPLQEKFINCVMKDGKKSTAEAIFRKAMEILAEKGQKNPVGTFEKAIDNIKPTLEVKPKRIGGAVYQIPMEVKPERQMTLSIRWLLSTTRSKKGAPMAKKLADEILLASNGEGAAIKKRDDVNKMAMANKAFAHYAKY